MAIKLDRRTFMRGALGGATASLALPVLEAMLDTHGEALAGGGALPVRYGVFFWGNGVLLDDWIPDQVGAGWQPKSLTQPFFDADTPVSQYVSLVSGLNNPQAGSAHHTGRGYQLCGSYDPNLGTYGNSFSPTSDQLVADQLQGPAPYRSLEIGISRRGFENSSNDWAVSWVDAGAKLPAEHSPHALFERLFGDGDVGGSEPNLELTASRTSVLDAVAADAEALKAKLGASDRARLEQHLDGVRALELQLEATPPGGCVMPTDPGDFPEMDGQEQLRETSRAMSMLLAHALACDLTRTFTVKFTGMQTDTYFWEAGATEGLHTMTHDQGMQGMVHDAIHFMMKELAFLLHSMATTPEGTGNVLDNVGMYCTTELAEGYSHSINNMPVLVCGRAGGALKSGLHVAAGGDHTSKAPLTVMRACGADVEGFGAGDGWVTDSLGILEG